MTLTLPLSPDTEARLRERAAAAGMEVTAFIVQAIEQKPGNLRFAAGQRFNLPELTRPFIWPLRAADIPLW